MHPDMVNSISVLAGMSKDGVTEDYGRLDIRIGEIISIVGPTGSGKSALINDIEVFAQGDTATGRRILVNGEVPPEEMMRNPAKKPIALISQNTRCIADLPVEDFLNLHMQARGIHNHTLLQKTLELANEFTGEKILLRHRMSALSGGQTRSLFIADAIVIGATPIILLDEVENAGIYKDKVMTALKSYHKAVILVTHDPYLALCSDRRLVMKKGAISRIIESVGSEKEMLHELSRLDVFLSDLREKIRTGHIFPNFQKKCSGCEVPA